MYNSANSTFLYINRTFERVTFKDLLMWLSVYLSEDNVLLHYKAVFYGTSIKEELCRLNALFDAFPKAHPLTARDSAMIFFTLLVDNIERRQNR